MIYCFAYPRKTLQCPIERKRGIGYRDAEHRTGNMQDEMQLPVANNAREIFDHEFAGETDVHGHLACFDALNRLQRAVRSYGKRNSEM